MGRSGIRLLWNLGACGNGFVWNCGILPDASCFCLPVICCPHWGGFWYCFAYFVTKKTPVLNGTRDLV